MERRLAVRISTRVEAMIYCPFLGKRTVSVRNMSTGGMLIHAPGLRLEINTQLLVEFNVTENDTSWRYVMDALVVRRLSNGGALTVPHSRSILTFLISRSSTPRCASINL